MNLLPNRSRSSRNRLYLFVLALVVVTGGVAFTAARFRSPRPDRAPTQPPASPLPATAEPKVTPSTGAAVEEVARTFIDDAARAAIDEEWKAAKRMSDKGAVVEWAPDQLHVTAVRLGGPAFRDAHLADLLKMPKLKSLIVWPDQITNAAFTKYIGELKNLEQLAVPGLEIDDDACEAIGKLTHLTALELGGTRVSDDGLVHVKKLVRLSRLGLAGTRVTAERLADFAPVLKNLRQLDLRGVALTTDDLAVVGRFTTLEELYLPATEPSNGFPNYAAAVTSYESVQKFNPVPAAKLNYAAGAKHLAGLVNLKSFEMTRLFRESPKDSGRIAEPLNTDCNSYANLLHGHHHPSTNKSLEPVEVFTRNVRTDATGNLVCRRGDKIVPLAEVLPEVHAIVGRPHGALLEHLKGFKRVTSLDLSNLLVKDDDLKFLAGHTKLERLDLSGQYVTAAGLAHLKNLPLKHLNLRGCRIGDDDLGVLREIRTLKEVVLSQTRVTEAGGATFRRGTLTVMFDPKQKRPVWCDIDWPALADAASR